MTYLLFGLLLNDYPDNFAFEFTSRLLTLYGLKPNITNLIKQCDEQSPRHCALIVPYRQMQPPGNGLMYAMNKHTTPVVDLDFANKQMAAISLSNKIVLINMRSGNTAIDLNLPKINESYLNSTTLPNMIINQVQQDINKDEASDDNDSDEEDDVFKYYAFFVNSYHHVYLITAHGDIKFQRTSENGFLTAEIINRQYGLCILAEKNSNTVECWNLGQNKLFSTMNLSTNVAIKNVLCSRLHPILISIILIDGTIHFYALNSSSFTFRGTINAGKHLDLVVVDKDQLICTFDSTIPIDFVHIDLHAFSQTEKVLSDKDIYKTVIAFNPPITPKPIERIIFPDEKHTTTDESMKLLFMALTKECLCIVHTCMKQGPSYVRIPGQYDVVSTHIGRPQFMYTARRGIINMFKWQCTKGEDDNHNNYHQYQLFVSIDISSSSVLTIRPSSTSGKNILERNKIKFYELFIHSWFIFMFNGKWSYLCIS